MNPMSMPCSSFHIPRIFGKEQMPHSSFLIPRIYSPSHNSQTPLHETHTPEAAPHSPRPIIINNSRIHDSQTRTLHLIPHSQDLSHGPGIQVHEHSPWPATCDAQNGNREHIPHITCQIPHPSQLEPTPRLSVHIPGITPQVHTEQTHVPRLMR